MYYYGGISKCTFCFEWFNRMVGVEDYLYGIGRELELERILLGIITIMLNAICQIELLCYTKFSSAIVKSYTSYNVCVSPTYRFVAVLAM